MKIFDAHISGSLSVSSSAEISNNLLVSGNLTVVGIISGSISGSSTNADTASFAPKYTLTSSFNTFTSSYTTGSFTGSFIGGGTGLYGIPASGITGLNLSQIAEGSSTASISSTNGLRVNTNTEITGTLTATGQISGSFKGDGTNLYNIPASGVTGLNLTRIADGVATASISNANGLRVNSNTEITGALTISGSISLNGVPVGTGKLDETTFQSYTSSNDSTNTTQNSRLTSIESTTSSLNSFTGSIDTTIKNKLNTETVISGSVQVLITGTTGYSTFSSSISTSIGSLSSSVATTTSGLSSSIGSLSSSVDSLSSSIATTTSGLSSSIGSLSSSVATTTSGLSSSLSSSIGSLSSSVATTTSGLSSSIGSLSSSIATTDSNQDGKLTSLESYTGSNNTVIGTLQTSTSSLNTYTSSNTTNINAIHTSTGSFKSFTSSFDTAIGLSGADVTVKGNFTVSGTSTTVNSTTVEIGDNIIQLNGTGATNAGLVVRDATAPNTVSGSLLWDSTNDNWVAGALGSEQRLVRETEFNNAVTRIGNVETSTGSLNSFTSSINTTIKSKLNTEGVLSGSIQVNHNATTNYVANQHIDHTAVSITAGSGLTGGGDISTTRTINIGAGNGITVNADDIAIDTASATFTTGVKSKLNTDGVISGSAQIDGSILGSNKTITIGSTSTTLGGTSTSLAGLTSVTSTAFTGSLQGLATSETLLTVTGRGNTTTDRINVRGIGNQSGGNILMGNIGVNTNKWSYLTGTHYNTSTQPQGVSIIGLYSDLNNNSIIIGGSIYEANPATEIQFWTHNATSHATGGTLKMTLNSAGNLIITGTVSASNFSGTSSGTNTGDETLARVNALAITTVGTITSGTWNGSAIGNAYLANSSFNIGTTSISLGRASASQTLTGISIDGNAATVTNFSGTHTGASSGTNTGDETLARINALAITTVGTITSGVWNGSAIGNSYLSNSSFYLGSTSISLGRASATLNLAGVNTDGYAASLNGYSNQTLYTILDGPANGPVIKVRYDSATANRYIDIGSKDGNGVYSEGLKLYNGSTITWLGYTVYHSGNIPTWNQSTTGTASNITAYTINQSVGTGNSPTFVDTTLTGGLTIGGSLSRGTYISSSNYVTGADNIVLKGNSSGVSGIFFESEKDGTNINHPSDFAFIQYFPYGIGGSSGEANRLVIGTSNDADDMIVMNPVDINGLKLRVGAGTTDYTIYHSGNVPTWNQNTTGTASNITAYTINQSVGTGNSPTFAGITVNGTVVASQSGFQSATYASGRNRIWSFGNADAYGLSYFQGSGGYGGSQDMIGFHFGTASVAESKFTFVTDGRFFISGGIFPSANGTHNLGSSSLRWNTLFTSDLSLSNGIGDYTIVEGENDLFLYNNKQNKVYKFMLQEVKPEDATPKRPE